jgi:hypothetical protein
MWGWLYLKTCLNTSRSKNSWGRYNVHRSSWKVVYPLFLSDFNGTWIFSTDFRKILITAWLRFLVFFRNFVNMKVVRLSTSHADRLYLLRKYFWYSLLLEAGWLHAHSTVGRITIKISNHTIGNRTRDLPACTEFLWKDRNNLQNKNSIHEEIE